MLLNTYAAVPGMARGAAPAPAGGDAEGPLYYRTKGRRPKLTRNPNALHPWEVAAIETERWIRAMPEQIANAVMPQGRAPFTTDAPKAEQVDYWLAQFVLPDGALNLPAVQAFLTTTDPDAIRGLARAIEQRKRQGPPQEAP
jgi:hypothetical protein